MTIDTNSEKSRGLFIEVAGTDLNFRTVSVADATLTGRQILAYSDLSPRDEFVVLQWLEEGDIEELRSDEIVKISGPGGARFIVARSDRLYRLILNDHSVTWPEKTITETALRMLGKVPVEEALFIRREDHADKELVGGSILSLADVGVENIYSRLATWELNVQGVVVKFDRPDVVVREALAKAGFNPEQGWIIVLKTRDAKRQVTVDEIVDLRSPGIEKLRLTPREINNGEMISSRRQFRLLSADEQGLTARGLNWETLVDSGRRWLVLHDVDLPSGYDTPKVDIAIEVPTSYPAGELDMFYCYPHLARIDGMPIPQTQATETVEGKVYQRWSRHRGSIAPWRAGQDNVITHLALVEAALLREVEV